MTELRVVSLYIGVILFTMNSTSNENFSCFPVHRGYSDSVMLATKSLVGCFPVHRGYSSHHSYQ